MNRNKTILIVIFFAAILLRLTLAVLNNGGSYDNHLGVSNFILSNGFFPKSLDCWQCYHPKLYHFIVAKLWQIFKENEQNSQLKYIIAQEINAIAGIINIFIIWFAIKKLDFTFTVKIIVFVLIAFNPRLIAISCQPTNDSFIILFGSIIIYTCHKFIIKFSIKDVLVLLVFSIFAGLTKTNSFILIIGIIISISIKTILSYFNNNSIWKKYLYSLTFICLLLPIFLYSFGDFKANKLNYDTYFPYNTPLGPIPYFLKKTNYLRPGIQSIFSGYLTFRFFNMLQYPTITTGNLPIPLHRTSFFSQLYGYSNFLYFDSLECYNWICKNKQILNVGRISLFFGMLPTLMLLIGLYYDILFWIKTICKKKFKTLNANSNWVNSIFAIGFIIFLFIFTLKGRDFSFIKITYIFPGLIAILKPFLIGCERIQKYCNKKLLFKNSFWTIFYLLIICYIIPVLHLLYILLKYQLKN